MLRGLCWSAEPSIGRSRIGHEPCIPEQHAGGSTVGTPRTAVLDGSMPTPLAWRPHPWHGIEPGARFPDEIVAYIELVPTDGVKYEIDKHSGYLRVDRPQRYSSQCPTLYGFVPQTYCGERVAAYRIPGGPTVTRGDGDPLDVCVLTDRAVSRGEILLEARPIGGLRMVERGEADD